MLMVVLAACGLVSFACPAAGQSQDEAGQMQAEVMQVIRSEDMTAAEKVTVLKKFVTRFPNHNYASVALSNATRLMTTELNRGREALALVRDVIKNTPKGEMLRRHYMTLLWVAGTLKDVDTLRSVEAELRNLDMLDYEMHNVIADSAFNMSEWQYAYEQYGPGLDVDDESIARKLKGTLDMPRVRHWIRWYRSRNLSSRGWCLVQMGRVEEALPLLRTAYDGSDSNLLGLCSNDSMKYLGLALLRAGRLDEAVDILARDGIIGGSAESFAALREAYEVRHGSLDGFDEFVERYRDESAAPAPDFTLEDYNGRAVSLSNYQGKVVLLNFWFPTCGPCRVELPALKEVYEKHQEQGLAVICVEVNGDRAGAEQFIRQHELPYVFVEERTVDGEGIARGKYNPFAFPTSYIIGRDGKVHYYHLGFDTGDEERIEKEIAALLSR
jgi:peroxiredoxin